MKNLYVKGFTYIELIIVIAIIAVLSTVLIPKFIGLNLEAQQGITDNLAARLNSGARMNYYSRTLNSTSGIRINNCRNVANTLQESLPSGYTIPSKNIGRDRIVACTLKGPQNTQAFFNARGIR